MDYNKTINLPKTNFPMRAGRENKGGTLYELSKLRQWDGTGSRVFPSRLSVLDTRTGKIEKFPTAKRRRASASRRRPHQVRFFVKSPLRTSPVLRCDLPELWHHTIFF